MFLQIKHPFLDIQKFDSSDETDGVPAYHVRAYAHHDDYQVSLMSFSCLQLSRVILIGWKQINKDSIKRSVTNVCNKDCPRFLFFLQKTCIFRGS